MAFDPFVYVFKTRPLSRENVTRLNITYCHTLETTFEDDINMATKIHVSISRTPVIAHVNKRRLFPANPLSTTAKCPGRWS